MKAKKYVLAPKTCIYDTVQAAANAAANTGDIENYVIGIVIGDLSIQSDVCVSIPGKVKPKKIKLDKTVIPTNTQSPTQKQQVPVANKAKYNKCSFDNEPTVKTIYTPKGIAVNLCELHLQLELPIVEGDYDPDDLQ